MAKKLGFHSARTRRLTLKLYRQGMPAPEILERLAGWGHRVPARSTITRWARAAGIERSPQEAGAIARKAGTGIDYHRLRELSKSLTGLSQSELARELGVSVRTAARWIRERRAEERSGHEA